MSGYSDATLLRAKRLRREMTESERKLWAALRARRAEAKWRKQQPIGRFVVDFFCPAAKLIVEVDGGQHCESETDARRTLWLEGAGYRVVRFWNNEVLENLEGVVARIREAVAEAPSPTAAKQQAAKPSYPLPQGERGALVSSPLEGEDSEACARRALAQLGEGA